MKIFPSPISVVKNTGYLQLLIVLIPLMNFLSGLSIDLAAPSMPAMALHFHTSILAVKSTVTALLIGFSLGCIIFGVLFDTLGRREIILSSLVLFVVVSYAASYSHTISELLIMRFLQGLSMSVVSIGSRTLVVDHFEGQRYRVAILYTSLAYGSGPVLGPFIGGYLQYHFGWQANFYTYALLGLIIFSLFLIFIHESLPDVKRVSLKNAISSYKTIMMNRLFVICAILNGMIWIEQLLYPLIGPFLLQNQMGYSSITYGNTALLAGLSYVLGTLSNRFLVKFMNIKHSIILGLNLSILAIVFQLCFALTIGMNLWTLIIPIMIMGYSTGFIFPNILSFIISLFPNNAGVAAASASFLLILTTAMGTTIISALNIHNLLDFFWIYLVLVISQCAVFVFYLMRKL